MEIRLTRRPGEAGTKKLVERFGERLVCVRYRYDAASGRRLKTAELIIESVPWTPRAGAPRRRHDEIVTVRILFAETELARARQAPRRDLATSAKIMGDALGARLRSRHQRPNRPDLIHRTPR